MPRIDIGELSLNVEERGTGPAFLFIPGLVGLLNAWEFQMAEFAVPPGPSESSPVIRSSRGRVVGEHRDRPRRDIAHQPDLGHVPPVGERLGDDGELAPAQIGLGGRLAHPQGRPQKQVGPFVTTLCNDAL